MTNEELGRVFNDYANRHNGRLDETGIREEMLADPNHPLRNVVEMDRDRAAAMWQLTEIRKLIRRWRITVIEHQIELRVPGAARAPDDASGGVHELILQTRARPLEERREALRPEVNKLRSQVRRIRAMAAVLDVGDALDGMDMAVDLLSQRLAGHPSIDDQPAGRA